MTTPAPPVFVPLTIDEIRAETAEHIHVSLKAPPEFLSAYTLPGQYVQIAIDGMKPSFFAIANGPTRERLEFLIKRGSPAAEIIAAAKKSGELLNAQRAVGQRVSIGSCAGTRRLRNPEWVRAWAPLRALMHFIMARRTDFAHIHFLYGARKADLIPYIAEIETWKSAGVHATCVCSKGDEESWSGAKGYVQDFLRSAKPDAANAVAYICGMKPMVEGVKAAFAELGLTPDRIHQNF